MTAFRHPAFAKLTLKIARAEGEIQQIEKYIAAHEANIKSGDWGSLSAVSLGVHNVYNGIEDILLSLANDVDGNVPSGPTAHQDVIDQMSAELKGVRSAVLGPELSDAISELKRFRHLIRHRYGFELRADKVWENIEILRDTLPRFISAVALLEHDLLAENEPDNDGGDGAGGGVSGGPN